MNVAQSVCINGFSPISPFGTDNQNTVDEQGDGR